MKYFSVLYVTSGIQQCAYHTKMLLKSGHLMLSENLSADVGVPLSQLPISV